MLMSTYIRILDHCIRGFMSTQRLGCCLCPHTSGFSMVSSLYLNFYVHIETNLFFMSTYIRILNGLKFYVHIDTSLLLMFTYIRFDNGLRLLQEVLCPHRNQSVLYRYQSFAQPCILPRKYNLVLFSTKILSQTLCTHFGICHQTAT